MQSYINYAKITSDLCEYIRYKSDLQALKNYRQEKCLREDVFYLTSDLISSSQEKGYLEKFIHDNENVIYIHSNKDIPSDWKRTQYIEEENFFKLILSSSIHIYFSNQINYRVALENKKIFFLDSPINVANASCLPFKEHVKNVLEAYTYAELSYMFGLQDEKQAQDVQIFLHAVFGNCFSSVELNDLENLPYVSQEYVHWIFNMAVKNKLFRKTVLEYNVRIASRQNKTSRLINNHSFYSIIK